MWPIDSPPRWVDRSQELATLRAGVEALRQGGSAAVWVEGDQLVCQLSDSGYIADPLAGRIPPALGSSGGRG